MTFAFIFESIGGTEWLVLLGVVLIIVGPKNLPAAARKMGAEDMARVSVFDDSFLALRSAKAAGMKAVAVYDAVASEPWEQTVLAAAASIRHWKEAKEVWNRL